LNTHHATQTQSSWNLGGQKPRTNQTKQSAPQGALAGISNGTTTNTTNESSGSRARQKQWKQPNKTKQNYQGVLVGKY